jgi:hypothetical protein
MVFGQMYADWKVRKGYELQWNYICHYS